MKKLLLIGNYEPDNQVSMARFCEFLANGFSSEDGVTAVEVRIWVPTVVFGRLVRNHAGGVGKWLGYVDKWILSFLSLMIARLRVRGNGSDTYFHICDHSNAPYLAVLPRNRTTITCHDVLAIQGALGFESAYCPASTMGKILQKWILSWLKRFQRIAFVSAKTRSDYQELATKTGLTSDQVQEVIPNGLNRDFEPMDRAPSVSLLKEAGIDSDRPFLFHVGSDLPRKNRSLLVKLYAARKVGWNGSLVLAGALPGASLRSEIKASGAVDDIICLDRPSHELLVALYSSCHVFVFPSFSEGFGWPLIEAQACGAPVVASELEPLPEVGGMGALYADPSRVGSFQEALAKLDNSAFRESLIAKGLENARKYQPDRIRSLYQHFLFPSLSAGQ